MMDMIIKLYFVISFLSLKISYVNSIIEVGFFEQKTLIKKISPKINGFINFTKTTSFTSAGISNLLACPERIVDFNAQSNR